MSNWYYLRGREKIGPMSETEMIRLYRNGQLMDSSYVYTKGMSNWKHLFQTPLLDVIQNAPAFEDPEEENDIDEKTALAAVKKKVTACAVPKAVARPAPRPASMAMTTVPLLDGKTVAFYIASVIGIFLALVLVKGIVSAIIPDPDPSGGSDIPTDDSFGGFDDDEGFTFDDGDFSDTDWEVEF